MTSAPAALGPAAAPRAAPEPLDVVGAPLGPRAGAAAGWSRAPWWLRGCVVLLALVLAGELVVALAGRRTVPAGATSPYSTSASGTAALVALLARVAPTTVDADALAATEVPAGGTLVVLDPRRWSGADARAAAGVAARGGTVVFVGAAPADPGPPLPAGASVRLLAGGEAGPVTTTAPTRLAHGVSTLVTGAGVLSVHGDVRIDVATVGGPFVASSGRVVWVASSLPLRNAHLDQVDDAALAWNLVAPFGRPVVIDVSEQAPPPTASGLRALPSWWLAALGVGFLALAVWLFSAARRFGPLERSARALPPGREGHAVAVGALLAALPPDEVGEACAPVARAASRALHRRLVLHDDAGARELEEAAVRHDVPAWVLHAATATPSTRDQAIETGRALAWLEQEGAR